MSSICSTVSGLQSTHFSFHAMVFLLYWFTFYLLQFPCDGFLLYLVVYFLPTSVPMRWFSTLFGLQSADFSFIPCKIMWKKDKLKITSRPAENQMHIHASSEKYYFPIYKFVLNTYMLPVKNTIFPYIYLYWTRYWRQY